MHEPEHDGFHVLLSDIIASTGKWEYVVKLMGKMKQRGVIKSAGHSVIKPNGIVHEFLAGDGSHPQVKEIGTNDGSDSDKTEGRKAMYRILQMLHLTLTRKRGRVLYIDRVRRLPLHLGLSAAVHQRQLG